VRSMLRVWTQAYNGNMDAESDSRFSNVILVCFALHKEKAYLQHVCNTRILVLLAYTHTEKAYFNGKTTNIDTKVLL